jgi:hypothetical protein
MFWKLVLLPLSDEKYDAAAQSSFILLLDDGSRSSFQEMCFNQK